MRELTMEEIDQVSAGPTPSGLVAAIPTIFYAADSRPTIYPVCTVGVSAPLLPSLERENL